MLGRFFRLQKQFQREVTGVEVGDSVQWSSYHVLGLVEEVGELLKADKRWKTHRNKFHDEKNKLEELADCFITLMNVALWSGVSTDDFCIAVENKIRSNFEKLREERSQNDDGES